ncbi:MAG: hypothetical protein A2V67_05980 [Deltaproteobacteria bacterium RBG_13_61_14]|nr:MAG: hypothetical protein A2V67_05980 [Deltaproteobacteria bacterium RBG_13_61_14]
MRRERLQALRPDMTKCFRCSLCKMVPLPVVRDPRFTDACPASRFYHFHGYSGSGKQIAALSLLDGRIEPDSALADIAFACTACGYCDVACKFIMAAERHQVNMALREFLADKGLGPESHRKAVENLKRHGHADGPPRRSPGEWAQGLDLKILPDQKAEVLLFAGCVQRNDDKAAAAVRKLARLLVRAGVDVGILGDQEPCCGLPAYWTGHREDFSDLAFKNASLIKSLGVRTVVTASSCLGAFRSKYPEYAAAMEVEVLHAAEFLCRLLEQGRLSFPLSVEAKVTYHDPCYLGRQSEAFSPWEGEEKTTLGVMTYHDPPKQIKRGVDGVYDAPRRLIRAIPGIELIEMFRIREYSFCCGAGGGVPQAYPELARAAARHRLEEARAVGAERLVSACARCEKHLREIEPSSGTDHPMPILDILDLLFEASGLRE